MRQGAYKKQALPSWAPLVQSKKSLKATTAAVYETFCASGVDFGL
jgi:hypothetical protein